MGLGAKSLVSLRAPRRDRVRRSGGAARGDVPADGVGGRAARRGARRIVPRTLGALLPLLRGAGMGVHARLCRLDAGYAGDITARSAQAKSCLNISSRISGAESV